jgi:hypothetical protein
MTDKSLLGQCTENDTCTIRRRVQLAIFVSRGITTPTFPPETAATGARVCAQGESALFWMYALAIGRESHHTTEGYFGSKPAPFYSLLLSIRVAMVVKDEKACMRKCMNIDRYERYRDESATGDGSAQLAGRHMEYNCSRKDL